MDSEAWPRPAGLRGLLRNLLGRPSTDGTDDLAMRADADRLGDELSAERGTNDQQIHPGFHSLVSRSGQRMARQMRRPGAALAKALARHTEAQAALDRREYERGVVARLVDDLPALPERPRLGVALTQPWAVWLLMLLVLIPLEGVLTYQQILILGLDVNLTKVFAALIGAALTVSAEVLGTFVAHVGSQASGDRRSPQHRGTYWLAAALACVTAVAAVATISTLATSRDANQQIVEQRKQQIEELDRRFRQEGYTPGDAGSAGSSTAAAQEQADSSKINLGFTLWLQLLGLLAAIGLGTRRRLAEDYQMVATTRRTTLRRSQLSERSVSRGERMVTRSAGRQEAIMRTMRTVVEDEYRFLQGLFQRALQRYRATAGRLADDCPVPELPDLEDVIRHFVEPELPRLAQPTTASVPVAQPPPPPVQWEQPAPRPRPTRPAPAPEPPDDPPPPRRPDVRQPPANESGYDARAGRWPPPSPETGHRDRPASEYDTPQPAPPPLSEYDTPQPAPSPLSEYDNPRPAALRPLSGHDRQSSHVDDVYDAIDRMRTRDSVAPPGVSEPLDDAVPRRRLLHGVTSRFRRSASHSEPDDPATARVPTPAGPEAREALADRSGGDESRTPAPVAGIPSPPPRSEADPTRWRRLEPPGSMHVESPYRDTLARLERALDLTSDPSRNET
jgi:hypothetical protein